jgi:DNA ligase (NAD+)
MLIPINCPSCGTKLKHIGVHLVCTNKTNCPEQIIQRITHFIVNCEIDGVSESTIRSLFDNKKIKSIKDLYSLKKQDLIGIEGFGDKKIDNLLNQLHSKKEMNIAQFVDRIGVNGVGEKAVNKLGIKNIDDLLNFQGGDYVIAQNLKEFLDENIDMINELLEIVVIKNVNKKVGANKVCMTGAGFKGRKELILDIESKGDEFIDSVSKETNILLTDDINSSSSKISKARKLGIKILTYNEYFGV